VVKTPEPTRIPEPGGAVQFTVTVQNTSPVDTVFIQTIIDDKFGDIAGSCAKALPAALTPGQSMTCRFTKQILGKPGDSHTNIVTATGVDDDGVPVQDDDVATVVIDNIPSRIEVIKTANPYWMYYPGGNVTFAVKISNLSTVDTVLIQSLVDSVYGDLNGQGSCFVPQALGVGASYSCSFDKMVAGEPDTTHTNVVTAVGIDDDGDPVSDDASATVTIAAKTTQVQFLYFRTSTQLEGIVVEWETAWEQDNVGFYLFRGLSQDFADAELIHFEPARGAGQFEGQYYSYLDRDTAPGITYYYWIQDIDQAPHEPIGPATGLLPYCIHLPMVTS
jgi:hypothetical protein